MRLTDRDIKILSLVYDQGVATCDQLNAIFFNSPTACRKRVSFLVRSGYLESIRLIDFKNHSKTRFLDMKSTVLKKSTDLWKVKLYRIGPKIIRSSPLDISTPSYFHHQLALNEVRIILEKTLKHESIILTDPDQRLFWSKFQSGRDVIIPDLVFQLNGFKYAIELERSYKSNLRIFKKLGEYKNSQFHKVLFIVLNDKRFSQFREVTKNHLNTGVSLFPNLNKVYHDSTGFISIHQFFNFSKC